MFLIQLTLLNVIMFILHCTAHEPVSIVFTISFKSRAAVSNDIKSAIKDSTNKNIPSIEVLNAQLYLVYLSLPSISPHVYILDFRNNAQLACLLYLNNVYIYAVLLSAFHLLSHIPCSAN